MKPNKKNIAKAFKAMLDDKSYIKKQVSEGEKIDQSKLKGGKIVKVTL